VFFVFGAWQKNYAPIYAPFNGKNDKIIARKKITTQRKCFIYFQIVLFAFTLFSPGETTQTPFFIGVAGINAPNHAPFW
jgi:hypothetical protein